MIGVSIAYHLAKAGQRNVVLLEREPFFGQGATRAAAGGIRYQFSTEINIRLSQHSLPMLDAFEQETGQPIGVRHCGYLFLLSREENVRAFEKNIALQNRLGVKSELLPGDEVRRRLPMMQLGDVLAGAWHAGDGMADPGSVVAGYVQSARRLGARLLNDVAVSAIETRAGKIAAVVTNAGRIETPTVVNATGAWAGAIGRMVGLELPITPVRRQWMSTTPLPQIPENFPFVIDFERLLYFHREGRGLLIGKTNVNQAPGFDRSFDREWEVVALEAVIERMPLLEAAGVVARVAGLYDMTPDAHPLLGRTPIEGFYLCAGFSGHGFMHSPICGKLLAEEILEGHATTIDIAPLRLDRFAQATIGEYNVI